LGAATLYDVLGARAFGFWSGPYDRRVDQDILNFSRVILLREELQRRGLASKPVWAIDGGWCALPSDWSGQASPSGSDTPLVQTQRLALAIERIQKEWPWMTWAAMAHWQPDVPSDDPLWGYALLNPSGERQAAYEILAKLLNQDERVVYPGVTSSLQALQPTQNPALTDLAFWGTRLWLIPADVTVTHTLTARVDVQHTAQEITLPQASGVTRLAVGRSVPLQAHKARFESQAPLSEMLDGFQVAAERPAWGLVKSLALGIGTVLALVALLWHELKALRWRQAWRLAQNSWRSVPSSIRALVLLAALIGASLARADLVVILCTSIAILAAALDPEHALLAAVLSVPLAPVTVRLKGFQFSIAEVAVLLAAGGYLWDALVERHVPLPRCPQTRWQIITDLGVIGLLGAGVLSASLAEYQHVAWREVRLCFLEPALLYYLLRTASERLTAQMVAPALLAGGALTGIYALFRYPAATGVIEAEGVRRALGFYGSPNNLALMAERLAPLALAGALWGQVRARRIASGLVAAILLVALALTFSKGALLLGLPFGLITLGYLRGGRWRWAAVAVTIGALLLAIPLLGTERLASMTDLSQGTGFLRIQLWHSAINMIADHPWFGVGPDGFLYYYGDYIRAGAQVEPWLSHPHNLLLSTWTRLGLPGVVAMLTLLSGAAGMILRAKRNGSIVAVGLAAGLVAATAHGMVDSFYFVPELALWLMVTLALLSSHSAQVGRVDQKV
ncbi:MAG: O-antigen ligase family protein, partial [Anaerolineae bacterium]|nr:O-antigen ligase family protein [Anaerolineae bacterium]